ncbi:MAG: hypothetical protein EOM37_15915 [Proteobacteria bacterium]|nr:hypothetical protein [Pseudomonadota bacterium]
MGELAARTIFSNDTGPLAGTGLDTLAKNQGAILELEGAQAPQSKTITDGSISPTAAYVIVDTEGSAAADDLDVINPVLSASENLHDGMVLYLKAADSGRVVTVKNSGSANGINTYDGNDYVLSATHWLKLQLRSGKWYEVEGRAMETALAAATAAASASTPATTTSRGIGRVATLADMVPGAEVENGPAFPDVRGGAITHTPTANAIPQAAANGKLSTGWVPGAFVGKIDLLPFRPGALATYCPGWYFCDGSGFELSGSVGTALNNLPSQYKADWGISISGSTIYLPKLFYVDGRGFFFRAVNGSERQVGSTQDDALQYHVHTVGVYSAASYRADSGYAGLVVGGGSAKTWGPETQSGLPTVKVDLNESRSLNIGMTPAIFLNV